MSETGAPVVFAPRYMCVELPGETSCSVFYHEFCQGNCEGISKTIKRVCKKLENASSAI